MTHPLEADFREWSKPPTGTEEQRCTNAERVVRNAIRSYPAFATRNIEVFPQGSYRNGTNVRANSDVDICVRCMDVCFSDVPDGYSTPDFGLVDATYTYAEFKEDVGHALKSYLGADAVTRGNKAFDLHENTYRVDADVVPTFEHRRYLVQSGQYSYTSGTELRPDNGGRIINWPHQNYENGTAKNALTNTRFKKLVRVLKRLRDEMVAEGNTAAEPIPSYLIECLVWNAPTQAFVHDEYAENLRAILFHLFANTLTDAECNEWGEINELKYLFRMSQPWTREDVNSFVVAAWNRAGFK
ncbi:MULTISPECIES: nucleotidyltransferase [Myxococcus]|uniref:nucleotidyltransferase domain-containing protein n=1 Tax=Myxococcus TaxID=32 RepID=UPI001144BD6E|nr:MULTISPECIES: nucleotidyltransferase [Myxococcus]NOK02937.1 nucleotidyltransferase [Myxococcus xanthus]